MTTSRPDLVTVTTVAAVLGELPQAGEDCVLAVGGQRSPARLAAVSTLRPGLRQGESAGGGPHWPQLASIRVEVPGDSLIDGTVRQFELLHEAKEEEASGEKGKEAAFAAGLAIGGATSSGSGVSSGLTIWLTGLSGAGKSTIAQELGRALQDPRRQAPRRVECLDADIVRTHLCKGLGFSAEDRMENVRRLALTARIIAETGAIVLVSAISPYRAARDEARSLADGFLEVYVNAPLSVCESRDVKGLYKRARSGEIKSFTGIDDPYEPPLAPDIECRTDLETIEQSVAKILAAVERLGEYVPARGHAVHFGLEASPGD